MTTNLMTPTGRYILPEFRERSANGERIHNPYTKLFEERIIFLGVQIDDARADDVMAQLLCLESMDPDRDIQIYINSPGGSYTAMTAIYDTIQFVKPQVQTVCLGQAASAAAVLLAAGTPGKRFALPHARILIHQPYTEGGGQGSDIEIQANEIIRMRTEMEGIIAKHTGRDARAGGEGHRARQDPHRGRRQGVRDHRRGDLLPQGVANAAQLVPAARLPPPWQARPAGLPAGERRDSGRTSASSSDAQPRRPTSSSALDSVLAEDYPDFDLVITDDASSDGTPDVIRAWLARTGVPADFVARTATAGVCATSEPGARAVERAVRLLPVRGRLVRGGSGRRQSAFLLTEAGRRRRRLQRCAPRRPRRHGARGVVHRRVRPAGRALRRAGCSRRCTAPASSRHRR